MAIRLILLLLISAVVLSGCGRRGALQPPAGAEEEATPAAGAPMPGEQPHPAPGRLVNPQIPATPTEPPPREGFILDPLI